MVNSESPPIPADPGSVYSGADISKYSGPVVIGGVVLTAVVTGVLSTLAPMGNRVIEAAILAVLYTGVFVAGISWFNKYRAADWSVPVGSEDSNWTLRKQLSLGLGALGILTTAICATVFETSPSVRALLCGQATVMAIMGGSDIRRFILPLPLMFGSVALAIALTVARGWSPMITLLAIGWGIALIVVFAVVAKNGIAAGDYIVLFVIALSAPFNGLISIMIAQLMMDMISNIVGWKRAKKRMPIGGAWLLATVFVLAAPQFPALLDTATVAAPVLADAVVPESAQTDDAVFTSPQFSEAGLRTLRNAANEASYVTGAVALENDRAQRIARAEAAAERIEALRIDVLLSRSPTALKMPLAGTLNGLVAALKTYDIDGVRLMSGALADNRARIDGLASAYRDWRQTPAAQALAKTQTQVSTDGLRLGEQNSLRARSVIAQPSQFQRQPQRTTSE